MDYNAAKKTPEGTRFQMGKIIIVKQAGIPYFKTQEGFPVTVGELTSNELVPLPEKPKPVKKVTKTVAKKKTTKKK